MQKLNRNTVASHFHNLIHDRSQLFFEEKIKKQNQGLWATQEQVSCHSECKGGEEVIIKDKIKRKLHSKET